MKMAAPVSALSGTINRLAPRLSENILTKTSLFQISPVARVSKRPNSANPGGWSRRKTRYTKEIPLCIQHANTSSSSANQSTMKKEIKTLSSSREISVRENLYEKFDYFSSSSPNKDPSRAHSLERLSFVNPSSKLSREIDRETDHWSATDRQPSPPQEKTATLSTVSTATTEKVVFNKPSDVIQKEESIAFEKRERNIDKDVVPKSNCDFNISESERALEEVLITNEKGENSKENGVEMLKAEEKTVGGEAITQEFQRNFPENTGPDKTDDWSTFLQRTVDINLNDLGTTNPELKKKLSMDINVAVQVKSQDALQKSEIGFQELLEHKNVKDFEKDKVMGNQQEMDKLYRSSETGILSQKDLTEEIGKVYNFLKNNGPIENSTTSNSYDIFQKFEKIKHLYFNALKCVKAFKELTGNKPSSGNAMEDRLSDLISFDGELAKSCNEKCNSSCLNQGFKYPTAFEKVYGSKNQYTESGPGLQSQKGQFLSGKPPTLMSVRTYAEGGQKSDCLKAKKLPCLQSTELSKGAKDAGSSTRSVCEKLCMPCCKPARDPPLCFYPYHKPPCKKEKAPRPAFSECKQIFEMKQVVPCECVRPRATSCKKSPDSEKCHK